MRSLILLAALAVTLAAPVVLAQSYTGESIHGVGADDQFGRSLVAGDLNGDGYNDVLVVSESGDATAPFNDGEVHVFFGGAGFPAAGLDANDADLVLSDAATFHDFGNSLAVGDLNGDGFADAVVGVPYNNDRVDESGAAYVYCGSATPDATRDRVLYGRLTVDNNPDQPGIADGGYNLGQKVVVADLNGDGFDDVVAGGFSSTEFTHEYHVYLGGAGVCSGPPVNAEDADAQIRISPGTQSEGDIAIGDINGDGYGDLVVIDDGDWLTPGAEFSGGAVFVFHSGPALSVSRSVGQAAAFPGDADAVILLFEDDGEGSSNLKFRPHIASGELSGDGFDDIAVLAERYEPGRVFPDDRFAFVYRGGASLAALTVTSGGEAEISLGSSRSSSADIQIGSVTPDSQDDLLVASLEADFPGDGTSTAQYIFDGPLSFPSMTSGDGAYITIVATSASSLEFPGTAPTPIGITNGAVYPGFGIGRPWGAGRAEIYVSDTFALTFPDFGYSLDPCVYLFRPWDRGINLCQGFSFELSPGVLDLERRAMSFGGVFIPDPQSNDPDNANLIDVSYLYDIDLAPNDCAVPGCARYVLNEEGKKQADFLGDAFVEVISQDAEVAVSVEAVSFSGQIRLITDFPLTLTPTAPDVFGSYDLYATLPEGGPVRITSIEDRGEFNPTWAPFGPYLIHDVAEFGLGDAFLGQSLYVTNAAAGASAPLPGTDGGNDADWWPFGLLIAYDRAGAAGGPDETIYLSAAWGGPRLALRTDAVDPSWSPTGRYLAFRQPSDGSIRARDLLTGREVQVVASGQNPAWSPDGRYIAYSDGDDLWRVRVRRDGSPLSAPVAVTSGLDLDSQPAWSPGGSRLAYQTDASGAIDIWTVPASGGAGSFLVGAPAFGDFDPAVYPSQSLIVAYAGYTDPSARLAAGGIEGLAPGRAADLIAAMPPEVTVLGDGLGLGADAADRLDTWLAAEVGGGAVAAEDASATFAVSVFPNPTRASATVRFTLAEPSFVTVTVLDLLGREVEQVTARTFDAGTHTAAWEVLVYPAGTYVVRVEAGPGLIQRRVTVVR